MADFDPDAYLSEKTSAPAFDPEQYLREKAPAPVAQGGVVSGILAGIGRTLNPIPLIRGALDIGPERTGLQEVLRTGRMIRDVLGGTSVEETLRKEAPEVAGERAALTGQLGTREQAAEITQLAAQTALLAAPGFKGVRTRIAGLRDTIFGREPVPSETTAPATERAAREVIPSATQERQVEEGIPTERPRDDRGGLPTEAGVGGGVQPEAPVETVTQQPQVVSTAVQVGNDFIKGLSYNESHDSIGERHGIGVPPEHMRGFMVTDAQGNERFVGREEAAPIAQAAGQVLPEHEGTTALHSQQLKPEVGAPAPAAPEPIPEAPAAPAGAPVPELPEPPTFEVKPPRDAFGSEQTPVSSAIIDMGGVVSKAAARKSKRLEGNEALWDAVPSLKHVTHNKIYKPGGEMPDVAAQTLYNNGLISDPSVDAMWNAVGKESASARTLFKQERAQVEEANVGIKQTREFAKTQKQLQAAGEEPVAASDLQVGDRVTVRDQEFKVTDIDPDTFDVTLADGTRYGVQTVSDQSVIYGQHAPTQLSKAVSASTLTNLGAKRTPQVISNAGEKVWQQAKATPDEFTGIDTTHLSPSDRRELAARGLSFTTDRQNRIIATYPRELRAEALRQKVTGARQADPFGLEAPESVEEQRARMAGESRQAEVRAGAERPLVGTAGDLGQMELPGAGAPQPELGFGAVGTEGPPPTPPTSPAAPEPGAPRTTGIAQRITGVPAGETPTIEEQITRGRNVLSQWKAQGINPEDVATRIRTTRQISPEDLNGLRAREEELSRDAYRAEDAYNANPSRETKAAWDQAIASRAVFRAEHVKPAQTIWAELGHGQQGETDIDTGSLTGMKIAFQDAKGRPPTPAEEAKLKGFADRAKEIDNRTAVAKERYDQALTELLPAYAMEQAEAGARMPTTVHPITGETLAQPEMLPATEITSASLQARFASRVAADPNARTFNFTQQDISHILSYAKQNYIEKGVSSLGDTIQGIANDTGLKQRWVAEALTKPKQLRTISNELYQSMSVRRTLAGQAKDYIAAIDEPRWKSIAKAIWRAPFAIAVYGHGTVGMITHAGANIFRPMSWGQYWPQFVDQFKFTFSPAAHEQAMQELVRNPNFIPAKRGGLANDPNLTYTDYGRYAKYFGLQAGRRGFDILKVYRQTQFDNEWAKQPDSIKSDPQAATEMSRGISSVINHSTGALGRGETGFLARAAAAGDPLAFAARLEATRWARVIGDPIKTADTFLNWERATDGDKNAALLRTRRAAEFGAFFVASLAANQALLKATGQKDSINLTDPSKGDFLKHKFGGHTVAVDGGLLMPIRLLARVTYDSLVRPRKELRGATRTEAGLKDIGQYALGKAAPSISIAKEAITGESFAGQLLPWSRDTAKPGKPKMSWGEYALSHAPIPLSGASQEIFNTLRDRGMTQPDAEAFLRGIAALGAELTGARVGQVPKDKQTPLRQPFSP